MAVPQLTMPDGSKRPMETSKLETSFSIKVSLDGEIRDIAIAYRFLLTYREWAGDKLDEMATEIERLRTVLADWHAHQDHCPQAQQEAKENAE